MLASQLEVEQLRQLLIKQASCFGGVFLIDQLGQTPNALLGVEASGVAQHDGLLGQRIASTDCRLQPRSADRLATVGFQPGHCLLAIAAGFSVATKVAQHGACIHRCQLILVTQQDQARLPRQGIEQASHHFQVNHRRFIDHQYIQLQWLIPVVNEVARIRSTAQQTVQCGNIRRNRLLHRGADRQLTDGLANGLGQACCCLAGGGGETNSQRLPFLHGRCLQQPQQAHDRGGLAGAGAAGDDAEVTSCRQRTGNFLPVATAFTVNFEGVREQGIEPTGKFFRCYRVHAQTGAQRLGNAALIVPVTTQVQTLSGQHQRPLRESLRLVPILHHRAQAQRPAPLRDIQAQQPLRR